MSQIRDDVSEMGDDMFARPEAAAVGSESSVTGQTVKPLVREDKSNKTVGWGRGPIPIDSRKFRYDVLRGRGSAPLGFSATRVDRMTAREAGDMLESIHKMYGVDRQNEARVLAFDKALFFEHAINGASLLQPGRGELVVDGMSFDIHPFKEKLGVEQRRFFRTYADEIADVVKEVLAAYDPYDHESVEKAGYVRQIAAIRGLHKYPHLIHDSSDACTGLSYDERSAVANSKKVVLESTVNLADSMIAPRTLGAKAGSDRIGGS